MSTPAVSPAERYAKFRERQAAPEFTSFRELYDFDFDPFQVAACAALTERGRGPRRGPHRLWQDRRGRVRRPPRADAGQEVLLHHADQGAVQPEVQRPRAALRQRHGRPAHRRQRHQRRRPGRRDDHRGPAEHALRGLARAEGPRLRGARRGALPRRPVAGRRLGRGDHPPRRSRSASSPCPRRSATPRSSATGSPRYAAAPRSSSTSTARYRCGSTCSPGRRLYDLFTDDDHREVNPELVRLAHREAIRAAAQQAGPRRAPAAAQRGAVPPGDHRPARRRGPAARDHVHLQPGGLRRRRPAVPGRGAAPDHAGRGADHRGHRVTADRRHPRRGPDRPRLPRLGARPQAGHRRAPRRACCPSSRRSSRSCSPPAWSGRSSPPRPWRSASTCPRGPWCSKSSTSGTAKATSRSPRASTPSSPGGRAAGASTSRATRSCCGSPAWTRARWRAWRAPVPTRSTPRSARPTTWRST